MYQTFLNVPAIPAPFAFLVVFLPVLVVLILWSIAWKGWALWIAARNKQKWWFIALLLINTVAIFEIIYIFAVGLPELKKRESSSKTPAAK